MMKAPEAVWPTEAAETSCRVCRKLAMRPAPSYWAFSRTVMTILSGAAEETISSVKPFKVPSTL
jgi:hypothetical protein